VGNNQETLRDAERCFVRGDLALKVGLPTRIPPILEKRMSTETTILIIIGVLLIVGILGICTE